eukprot:TRINITY_DN73500_c0_g1_i1.p2 TRINITY_DN73500_c0_g1~~TRINITY_DN73500_c0_g1_i1.p2  ORF type:complete len:164 (+),score=47.42 TRINITY_DN73500_c0_g1_i1:66-494(+)
MEVKKLLCRKNEEMRVMQGELDARMQMIPAHNLTPSDSERVYNREATIRSALARVLSDVVHLNTLVSSRNAPLANPEGDEEVSARVADTPTESVALRIETTLATFVTNVQTLLAHRSERREAFHAMRGTPPPGDGHDDCAVM